jgi:sec-independent protein translocase protein TatA
MGSLGIQEMIIILVIALIVFGPKKMPEIGKSLGKGIAEFKKASNDLVRSWEEEASAETNKKETQGDHTAT